MAAQREGTAQSRESDIQEKIKGILANHSGKVEQTAERRRRDYGSQQEKVNNMSYINAE